MARFYFDYASSCPPFPEALAEFSQISHKYFANPSSSHFHGRNAHSLLNNVKKKLEIICQGMNAVTVLTSGGTESNNLVIRSIMEDNKKGRLLLAADVHESSWFAKKLYKGRTDIVPLEKNGQISLEKMKNSLRKNTILFSAVHVNNETGAVHDVAAYGKLCRENHVLFHCDGAQALGHLKVNLDKTSTDFYTFSSHKFGGLRGVGGIFLNSKRFSPQILGGGQELGLRAGTENVAGITASVTALEKSLSMLEKEKMRLNQLTAIFLTKLSKKVTDFKVNSNSNSLPGLVSLSFPHALGANLVVEMDLRGFSISSGSACHSHDIKPSRLIMALGHTETEALGTIRISMGYKTTQDEVEELARTLGEVVIRQRLLA